VGTVKIKVKHLSTGFSQIFVDEKYCGTLEDVEDCHTVAEVLKNLIKLGELDNMEVMEERDGTNRQKIRG
jgi:hypothetical protein